MLTSANLSQPGGLVDCHPERRAAQLAAARRVVRGPCSEEALRKACEVLMALSDDPADLLLARHLRRAGQS